MHDSSAENVTEDIDNEKIQQLIDVNDLQASGSFISDVEWCQVSQIDWFKKPGWSYYCDKPICQIDWEQSVRDEVDKIAEDNPYAKMEIGEIPALESVNHTQGSYGLDTRPKIFDKLSKTWVLLDSGSCVTCVPKTSKDVINNSLKLK